MVGHGSGKRREEIEVGQEQFPVVKFGADKQATAVVEHVEHREVDRQSRKPADEATHPIARVLRSESAASGGQARADAAVAPWMGVVIFDGPAPDLGAVELEGVEAQGFGSNKAVGTRR